MKNNGDGSFTHSTLDEGEDFIFIDKWKKQRNFKISCFPTPGGLCGEGLECTDDNLNRPYQVTVLDEFEADPLDVLEILKKKIRKYVNRRHLEINNDDLRIKKDDIIRGTLESDYNVENGMKGIMFSVDDRILSAEDLLKILQPYEGFQFKLQIFDPSEDLD